MNKCERLAIHYSGIKLLFPLSPGKLKIFKYIPPPHFLNPPHFSNIYPSPTPYTHFLNPLNVQIFDHPLPPHTVPPPPHTHTQYPTPTHAHTYSPPTHIHTHTQSPPPPTQVHTHTVPPPIITHIQSPLPPDNVYARPPTLHTINACEGYNNRFNVRVGKRVKPKFWIFLKTLQKEKLAKANNLQYRLGYRSPLQRKKWRDLNDRIFILKN